MHLTFQVATHEGTDVGIYHAEFGSTSTIGELKMFLIGATDLPSGYPNHSWVLQSNNSTMTMSDETVLSQAGIKDNDLLVAVALPMAHPQSRAPGRSTGPAAGGDTSGQLENLRQHILSHPPTRATVESNAGRDLVHEGEDLNSVLNDRKKFVERWNAMEDKRRSEVNQRMEDDLKLDADVTEENQEAIWKRIQQERVQTEAGEIMEQHPEMFASVTMLYIAVEVNGHPVKAFVDSGAQMTVISPQLAEECGLTRHIDERYSGIARGVGTARILGRVHRTTLKIHDPNGYTEELPCSFTVMEGKGVDMLLGLDMLKRYQATIDLLRNCLVLPNGASLPFLPEHEIPKNEFDADGQATAGNSNSTANDSAPGPAGSFSSPKSTASNFPGAGRTLGPGPAPSIASSSSTRVPSSRASSATLNYRPSRPTPDRPPSDHGEAGRHSSIYGEDKIEMLIEAGARDRNQARELLSAMGGNMDMALSFLFDQ